MRQKKNGVPGEQRTVELFGCLAAAWLFAFLAITWSIEARVIVPLASRFCDLATISVVPCGSRLSSQSKSPTSISNAFCSPACTSLRNPALLFFIFGSYLSLRYFLWSAMGLLSRN